MLKNLEDLDAKRNEPRRLEKALWINKPLATAYYNEGASTPVLGTARQVGAEQFLDDWIDEAEASTITMLNKFAQTLRLHREGLLAWYDCPISAGPWRVPTTRSKPSNGKLTDSGIRDSSDSRYLPCTRHATKLIG